MATGKELPLSLLLWLVSSLPELLLLSEDDDDDEEEEEDEDDEDDEEDDDVELDCLLTF